MLSAGLPLPNEIIVHGFLTNDGVKISKLLGNSVDPFEVITNYGSDAVRHFLLTSIPIFLDSDFSTERLAQTYTTDLANRLGNLYSRIRVLCEKGQFEYWVKSPNVLINQDVSLLHQYELAEIPHIAWNEIDRLNAEINEQRPWELLKESERLRLHTLLKDWVHRLYSAVKQLEPYITTASQEIQNGLCGGQGERILFPPRRT